VRQSSVAPQPVTLVASDVTMIPTTDKMAKTKGLANGLQKHQTIVARTKTTLRIVRQPATQCVQQSASTTQRIFKEAIPIDRVRGSMTSLISVVHWKRMKHYSDVQPPAMKIALERTTVP